MLNFSHSDLNLFSPRAYVVFKTKAKRSTSPFIGYNPPQSILSLLFSFWPRSPIVACMSLVRGRPRPSFVICSENSAGHLQRFDFSVTTLSLNMAALCVTGSVTISLIFVTLMY